MTDPLEWLRDLHKDSDHSLEDLEAFSEKMQKMYGNSDQKLNTAMYCMTDFLQGANEVVSVYTNRMKVISREVGWFLQADQNIYEIPLSRLQH